jgi:hypothetical protein
MAQSYFVVGVGRRGWVEVDPTLREGDVEHCVDIDAMAILERSQDRNRLFMAR